MASKYKNHKQILSAVRGIIVYSVNPDVASQEETEISFLGASKAALLRPFELMKKGGVVVTGINANIEKVFTMTGMYKVLTIK